MISVLNTHKRVYFKFCLFVFAGVLFLLWMKGLLRIRLIRGFRNYHLLHDIYSHLSTSGHKRWTKAELWKGGKVELNLNSGGLVLSGVWFDNKAPIVNLLLISTDLLSACPLLLQKFLKAKRSRERHSVNTAELWLYVVILSVEWILISSGNNASV